MDGIENAFRSRGPTPDLTRRGFAMTTLVAGFTLAVRPLSAETIVTDTSGLLAGEVRIPVADGEIPAYRARPDAAGPFPTVLVVQEIFGVHEHIRDLCRRLAKQGYYAVAPELYARQGDVGAMTDIGQIISEIVSKVPDAQVMADLDAAAVFAGGDGGDPSRLAVTGFCWGGRAVWLYAAHNPNLKAAVAWYGAVLGTPTELQPTNPIDVAASLNAPVLGLYGGKDQFIPFATAEQMRDAALAAGKEVEIVVYPDADHGFNADYRPSYDEAAAKDGWARMTEWFARHGV